MGRPTILTHDLIVQVADLVKLGNYPIIAARACGIPDATWYEWLARGRDELGETGVSLKARHRNAKTSDLTVVSLYSELADTVAQAEAFTEARTVGTVVVAANSDHRAAIAFLERRHPQRWRQHVTTEMVGPDGGPIRQETKDVTERPPLDDVLAGILETMQRSGKLPKAIEPSE